MIFVEAAWFSTSILKLAGEQLINGHANLLFAPEDRTGLGGLHTFSAHRVCLVGKWNVFYFLDQVGGVFEIELYEFLHFGLGERGLVHVDEDRASQWIVITALDRF